MAATNKCLAQSNKSRTGAKATKKRRWRRSAIWCAGQVKRLIFSVSLGKTSRVVAQDGTRVDASGGRAASIDRIEVAE
jgi:hypothetical protein